MIATTDSADDQRSAFFWFLRGVYASVSLPGLLLMSAVVGYAALSRESGITLPQTLFMMSFIWALPAQVVLIGAMLSGAGLPAAAIAVSLSSVRLMPMVVALVPEMRVPATRKWLLYFLSHFIAVTSWVIAMQRFREVPRGRRTAFYLGIALTLLVGADAVIAGVYLAAAQLPDAVAAGLFFLMPMYFLTSLWGSARERASLYAMAFGLVLGPVFHLVMPGIDLLAAGLIGGVGAYLLHRQLAGPRGEGRA
jgi:predicted branched-subunit amino acid permease